MSGFSEDMPFFDEPNARPAAPSGIAARAMAARSAQNSAPDYLKGLNPEQRLAVETTEGPVLVLAGAGTGKTRVLTTRIAHILATGRAFPSQILAVTFTNKAAREMKQRIGLLIGEGNVEGMPWLGTFHSIGVKLLRRHAELAGLKSDFTILDTDDVVRLIKQIIQAEGLDDKRWPAKQFAQMIDNWKNKGLGPDEIAEGDARSFGNGKGRQLYKAYQERLQTLNACDFGDLLYHPIRIFRAYPDVLKDYHRKFKYILVDEYQDTNTAQYMWLRLLAQRPGVPRSGSPGGRAPSASKSTIDRTEGGHYRPPVPEEEPLARSDEWDISAEGRKPDRASEPLRGPRGGPVPAGAEQPVSVNICCVGDDDQSIYGWRGAEVDNILRFDKDFPGATIIRLERNYRSTAHILGAASHLIAYNEGRFGKTLFTDRDDPEDDKVHVHAAWDSEEEARAIGETIEAYQRQKHNLNDMAILVRASFQMRAFEDRFITLGLNYRVIGGPRFYERMEIRDALAFFRVVANSGDDLAFERIVNVPKRGLGEATIRQIHDTARAMRIPMLEAAATLAESDELKPKPRAALREVAANFERWQKALETKPHTELAETILEESGYTDMWKNDRSAEAPGRLENLKELIRSMEEYESLRSFLEHVALVMEAEQGESLDAVSIMTLHSAKGLEFETVFLPGWEEGLFPHQRALDEGGRSGLEEERRLAYVGLTRAKKNLHIWFVSNRLIHGLWQSTIPSRFLDELPETHVDVADGGNSYGGYGNPYGGGSFASGRGGGRQNPYGASRFDNIGAEKSGSFSNTYATPGWQRAQANRTEATDRNWGTRSGHQVERIGYGETDSGYGAGRTSVKGRTIEGELVAKSVADTPSAFSVGDRVFHQKFGNGNIAAIDGNKLTIDFDKAGQKRVLDGFVTGV
ncbi:ATP-dependent helicase [Mesorhizobium sp.]|uniref:ATP-dependent helicase n=1 Tax=Mesorhizobium sp. TaxID=1871066 RepID=UPI000FE90A41|nr:UvrD-helicase domain-containing protein [Mesorhizobium sp.]RWM26038.1 MAG: ATP-dependent DNA helicase [Mesorhizobium sp.]RWM40698.1 MAG: ATP-dependent DNA helicase [Mesorhizobium sp.]TJV52241.1 MAG: ATP-dependent DNA helicase [Mesorhizobium sp.]